MSETNTKLFKYSIIIPTYNRCTKLPRAITSVFHQSVDNWELIIIDDGSTDETEKYIRSINDKRIKYVYQDNRGPAASRNTGIIKAQGRYICFLDSDDEYLCDHLNSFEEIIDNNKIRIAVSDAIIRSKDGDYVDKPRLINGHINPNRVPCMQSICIRSDLAKNTLFKEELRMKEDVEFWIRISQVATPVFTNKVTSRVHAYGNDRMSNMNPLKVKETLELFEKIFSDPSMPVYNKGIVRDRLFPLHVVLALHYKESKKADLAFKHYLRAIRLSPLHSFKRWSISLILKMAWVKIRDLVQTRPSTKIK